MHLEQPGLLFVAATLLPLLSFILLALTSALRWGVRPYRDGACQSVYRVLGGDNPGPTAAYVATGAIGLACLLSVTGFLYFLADQSGHGHAAHHADMHGHADHHDAEKKEPEKKEPAAKEEHAAPAEEHKHEHDHEHEWAGRWNWFWVGETPKGTENLPPGRVLQLGYRIDSLSAVMFVMVTFIATLIHLFSIGYMGEELRAKVADHHVHTAEGHLHRRGRFGRFFLYLSLFCFSMLNLILADNLFQVFLSWELVGICSYLLIGFYFERQSASNAANKAFITNRVGDAGFIIGMLIVWTYLGTFNFEDIFAQVRAPLKDAHEEAIPLSGQIVRYHEATLPDRSDAKKTVAAVRFAQDSGPNVVLFTPEMHLHANQLKDNHTARVRSALGADVENKVPSIPYWLLVVAGLGIFLGCVGKSAQFPLHVWLPDAMEGPTPVSALIHAATMVAAGVYLVGRAYPLFTPDVLLVIAYTGAITLFVAASIALVMTDIKKVLAYSTVSQLGYMMLGLGIGGWAAGLFHLVTHAFFKALLFLGSGSVIYGCHHEQEMTKMGGLYPKMKITALTMLVGVLAIAGFPLFSGWYSKDAIVAQAFGHFVVHQHHALLFVLPLVTAGITTFYMFRMWFMTFTGEPRDSHVHEHAHESPWTMTVPLIVLASFSVFVAWGWPPTDPEASWLEHQLHHAQPDAVYADFGLVPEAGESWDGGPVKPPHQSVRHHAHEKHFAGGLLALGMAGLGGLFAALVYYFRVFDPEEARAQFAGIHRFLQNKWYFDELYSALLVRPAASVARWCRSFDTTCIDGVVDGTAVAGVRVARGSGKFDLGIVDGLVNVTGHVVHAVGSWLRVFQTGYIRGYILFLVLSAVAIYLLLSFLFQAPVAAGH